MQHRTDPTTSPPRLPTASIVGLVAAPVVAIVARVLWTPLDDDDPSRYITELGRHPDRSVAGAFLMIVSAMLLVPAAAALTGIFRRARPGLALVANAMIVVGAFGMAVMCATSLVATQMAREPDHDRMVDLWDQFFTDPNGELVFLAIVVGVIGFVLTAVGLYRSREVPRASAVLCGLGGAAILVTSGGPMRPLLLAAAVIALLGFGWIALWAHSEARVPVSSRREHATAAPTSA